MRIKENDIEKNDFNIRKYELKCCQCHTSLSCRSKKLLVISANEDHWEKIRGRIYCKECL
ncbi:MAG TPA: hypothetical protein P5150_03620 [Candidatus Ratteibacteria bacterium]|nr:hypothetical protein [Candidatus Ratteibacteria bacterium]